MFAIDAARLVLALMAAIATNNDMNTATAVASAGMADPFEGILT